MKNEHTFVILAYKESPYLEECILSLKSQTPRSDILVTTSTPSVFLDKVCAKHSLALIVNNRFTGISSDWSFAYASCQTKYLTLAHQDDIYLSEYTQRCLSLAKKYDNMLIAFTDYSELINGKVRLFNLNFLVKNLLLAAFTFRNSIGSRFLKKLTLRFGSPIPCPSVIFNKEYIGEFLFSEEFSCNMDWDAWLRLSERNGTFVYVKKALMLHRIHKDSQTSLQIGKKVRHKEEGIIFKRLWPRSIAKLLAGSYSVAYRANES